MLKAVNSVLRRIVAWVIRIKVLLLGLLLAASLSLNVATVAFSSVAALLSGAFEVVTGVTSVVGRMNRNLDVERTRAAALEREAGRLKATNTQLRDNLVVEKKRNAGLHRDLGVEKGKVASSVDEIGDLKARNSRLRGDIDIEKGKVAVLSKEITNLKAGQIVTYRGQTRLSSEAVDDTVTRVSRRAAVGAARNAGGVFAEGIPVMGISVIVGLAAWDVRDSCATMTDLKELQKSLGSATSLDREVSEVCGMQVPSRDEVWEAAKSSPGRAWNGAKQYLPDLPEWKVPDFEWRSKLPIFDWLW